MFQAIFQLWANVESISDGRILPIENTPIDFHKLTVLGEHIDVDFDELNLFKVMVIIFASENLEN